MKKAFAWYAPRVVSLALALVGVFVFFYYSDIIARAFQSFMKFEVDPSFTGGRVATVVYDPVGDDSGFGGLTYPANAAFSPHSLDLVRYSVHEPVHDAKWSDFPDFWQIDLAFVSGPARVRNIRIYIDVDGDGKGKTVPLDEMAEGVAFDPSSPWDYAIAISGLEGSFVSSDGSVDIPVSVSQKNDGREISVRVPLSDRRLAGLFAVAETAHYVSVGAWSPWGRDGFMPVAKVATAGSGGGAVSDFTPKIYDCLAPDGTAQEAMLSSWNEDELSVSVMKPVRLSMRADSSAEPATGGSHEGLVAELKRLSAKESADHQTAARAVCEKLAAEGKRNTPDYAHAAFDAGLRKEAEASFDGILSSSPDDAAVLAYKGSLVAMRGGEAPPLEAVDIVANAYRYLDRAVALAASPGEVLAARLNRGNVSRSVPETVFGKAAQGASDFLAAAEEFRKLGTPGSMAPGCDYRADIASAYVNAGLCFEIAGMNGEAGTWLREAARIASQPGVLVPASIRLELAKRFFFW